MQNKTVFEKARNFVYRNARPIDFALWRYHFENGSAKEVYDIIEAYQKPDGGFGYDIEPDCCNENSTPVATWQAINLLKEVGIDRNNRIVIGILDYLDSGKDFADGKWMNVVKTNNDHPHAAWWHCNDGEGVPNDNPTVSLAGFALKYADKDSALHGKAVTIIKSAVAQFIEKPIDEPHILKCYLQLYEYCASIEHLDIIDLAAFKNALFGAVNASICKQPDKWFTDYVTKPSAYFDESLTVFEILDKELCEREAKMIVEQQLSDGSFPITWLWYNDYTEYYVSANKWRSAIIRTNMLYLRALGML